MGKKEAVARIKINKFLEKAGWRFFDDEKGKANIRLEANVKLKSNDLNELGDNFEKTKNGYVDFLLCDEKGFPIIVLEAKKESLDPLVGKEQARRYANSQKVRYLILSNGNLHYFWDIEKNNPKIITALPSQNSILNFKEKKPVDIKNLINETIDYGYIAESQFPNYSLHADYTNDKTKGDFIKNNNLKFLRKYQLEAINSIQDSIKTGDERFLLEMATGTGKTLVSAAIIKLFLKNNCAQRVLFLVDRLELEEQAWKNFKRYLAKDYDVEIFKRHKDNWQKNNILVTTTQSLIHQNKFKDIFSPTDFDLVISDEAHRSISGNSRALFEYFQGYKIGLTATPKDYLKNIENLNRYDQRSIDRRVLLDTYKTFGCESGIPTFRYSLVDGINEGFLVKAKVIKIETGITAQLLSEEGYSISGEEYTRKDFQKTFFSEETNISFCESFLKKAFRDPISKEIGKTIIFCATQEHALEVTQKLNLMAHKLYPNKYNSDFAVQVTSDIGKLTSDFTRNFSNNNLNGNSKFLEGYKTSKTRVCVTYGMMSTGYDCEDILNICFFRAIFSPSDFVQYKGRGTRKYEFEFHKSSNEIPYRRNKELYLILDYFGNHEFFENDYNYDEVLKLPRSGESSGTVGGWKGSKPDFYNYNKDPILNINEELIGSGGMRIDRELFGQFEDVIKKDEALKSRVLDSNFEGIEKYIHEEIFEKYNKKFSLEKLRHSIDSNKKLDRRVSIREIIEKVFGVIKEFKTRDEMLEDELQNFVSIYKPSYDNFAHISNFLKAYITDLEIRKIVDEKDFGALSSTYIFEDFKALEKDMVEAIPNYVKDFIYPNLGV
jgi:type I restriction enzyme R subunit